MNRTKWGLMIGVALVAVIALVPVALADFMSDERQLDQLARSALVAGTRSAGEVIFDDIVTSDIVIHRNWAFGMIVARPPAHIHGTPDLRLFMARRVDGGWQVALEYTPQFYEWVSQSPSALMSLSGRMALLEGSPQSQASRSDTSNDSLLSLPFAVGEAWVYVSGPHGNNGDAVRPWTAIDLHEPAKNGTGLVRAAREGTVWRAASCPNFIRVDHPGGWQTGYYHLLNERVSNGAFVERGQVLGNTSNAVGCGGWSSAPHVHFTLRRNGRYLNIGGHTIGGWTIQEGTAAYGGSARRLRDGLVITRPAGLMYNDGTIGTSFGDQRHDYNRDARSDLWAVNMRDAAFSRVSLHIANGRNLMRSLFSGATGLPVQPEWLNSAFAAADWNGDGVPDLWVIHRWDGSERTAFRIMNGADPRFLIANVITALPILGDDVVFAVADYNRDGVPDVWAIDPRDTATNAVTVRIVNGARPQTYLVNRATVLPRQPIYQDVHFAVADYDLDGFPDLWAITPRDYDTGSVSVRIVSGRDWQTLLADTGTAIPPQSTDPSRYAFSVSDLNYDGVPDLWVIDRITGAVQVVSGANFSVVLSTSQAWFSNMRGDEWQVLGADRSRTGYAPQPLLTREPEGEVVLTEPRDLSFVWRSSGLARVQRLVIREVGGATVYKHGIPDSRMACERDCTITLPADTLSGFLRSGRAYEWRLIARNPHGVVNSGWRPLMVDIPGVPQAISPANNDTLDTAVPTFTWEARPHADRYRIMLRGTDNPHRSVHNLTPAVCDEAGICRFSPPVALADGAYFWRLIAFNDAFKGNPRTPKIHFRVQAHEGAQMRAIPRDVGDTGDLDAVPDDIPPGEDATAEPGVLPLPDEPDSP